MRDVLLALGAAVAAAAYVPLNVERGDPQSLLGSVDLALPIVPAFAVPYLVILPVFWALVVRGLVTRRRDATSHRSYRTFVTSALAAFVVSDLVFVAFPTVVPRPAEVDGPMAGLLEFIYDNDNRFNDLPSIHAAMGTLLFLYARSFSTRATRLTTWALASLAVVATVLLRQHSLLGTTTGIAVALCAWVAVSRFRRREQPILQ